jgi:hypothetical protein
MFEKAHRVKNNKGEYMGLNTLAHKIVDGLSTAMGGYSQVGNKLYGMALACQINNNGASVEQAAEAFSQICSFLCEQWEEDKFQSYNTRQEIVEGIKSASEKWNDSVPEVLNLISEVSDRQGFAVVYDCGWINVNAGEHEYLNYGNQSGWFVNEDEAQRHADQLNGSW